MARHPLVLQRQSVIIVVRGAGSGIGGLGIRAGAGHAVSTTGRPPKNSCACLACGSRMTTPPTVLLSPPNRPRPCARPRHADAVRRSPSTCGVTTRRRLGGWLTGRFDRPSVAGLLGTEVVTHDAPKLTVELSRGHCGGPLQDNEGYRRRARREQLSRPVDHDLVDQASWATSSIS
jgi:hypothetical protein